MMMMMMKEEEKEIFHRGKQKKIIRSVYECEGGVRNICQDSRMSGWDVKIDEKLIKEFSFPLTVVADREQTWDGRCFLLNLAGG